MQYADEVLGPGSEWKPAVRRWLRAAAESGQSEAAGWPEVPPPVDTRELLTLTPACVRAQIDGIGADPRSTGDYNARGCRRSRRLLRAESCLADALRDARGQGVGY